VLQKTAPKIILAAYWDSKGITQYAMGPNIYSAEGADEIENARRATYQLFKRQGDEIKAEKTRQSTLPQAELEIELNHAREEVRFEADVKRARRRGETRQTSRA